jgi:hypothetical protein
MMPLTQEGDLLGFMAMHISPAQDVIVFIDRQAADYAAKPASLADLPL